MDTRERLVKQNPLRTTPHPPPPNTHIPGVAITEVSFTQYHPISKSVIQNMWYYRNFAKAGLDLSPYMVATQESIKSR